MKELEPLASKIVWNMDRGVIESLEFPGIEKLWMQRDRFVGRRRSETESLALDVAANPPTLEDIRGKCIAAIWDWSEHESECN